MFADEPTGNLDSRTGATIMELMFELNRTTRRRWYLVTHDQGIAERCDRILSLDVGKLVGDERTGA